MFQEILSKAEEVIYKQMTEKFGLTAEESEKSAIAFRDELNRFISSGADLGQSYIQAVFKNVENLNSSEKLMEFKERLTTALEEKAGLSPEMAARVRDFSVSTYYQTLKEEFTDSTGKIDIQKVLSILPTDIESRARDVVNTVYERFRMSRND